MRNQKKTLVPIFSQIYVLMWMKFSLLPQPVGFLKRMLTFFLAQVIFKGENSANMNL